LSFLYNICYTVALYALLLFYVAAADLLAPHKPILKFVVIKSVVFLTFWQSLGCSLMVNLGILYDGDEARALQNFLICAEMVLAGIGTIFAFPYTTYSVGSTDSFMDAVWHAASVHDVYTDIVHQFAGRYGSYVLYSEDTEAAPKRHWIRERMDAAALAAALAVTEGVEGVKDGRLAEVVRDGVLDGVLDHAAGTLESRGAPNVYGGKEPQEAFHRRITFCLDVHAEAVRAMRYPPSAARAVLESAEAKAVQPDKLSEARKVILPSLIIIVIFYHYR
jgi:hypothetical protein